MLRAVIGVFVSMAALMSAIATKAEPLSANEQRRIDAIFAGLQTENVPGVAVGIVRDGETVLARYAGLADMSHKTPLGPESRFNIASNAKQYVALMTLDLAVQGQIDLDSDFRTYLPGVLPEIEQTITVTHLITHTSGVRDIYDLWGLTGLTWYENRLRNRDAIDLLNRQTGLNFAPGSAYLYSNSNYIILAELIAAASGEDFDDYAGAFFEGLDMASTGWRGRYGEIVPNRARAYGNYGQWFEDPAIANLFGDGFLFTTLPDQLAWEQQLQRAGSSLSADLIAQSQSRPDANLPGEYGYGLEVGTYRGLARVSHVGSTGGYNAFLSRFPEHNLAIVVIGNTAEIGVVPLGNAISDALLADEFQADATFPAGPAQLQSRPANADVLGLYDVDSGTLIRVVERDGELFREIEGRDPVRLIHEEGNLFAYESNADLKMAFDRDQDGEARMRIFFPQQATLIGSRLPALTLDGNEGDQILGRYRNDETGFALSVEAVEGDVVTVRAGGNRFDGRLVAPNDIRAGNYRLRLERDETGQVDGMRLDGNRIRDVALERVDGDA